MVFLSQKQVLQVFDHLSNLSCLAFHIPCVNKPIPESIYRALKEGRELFEGNYTVKPDFEFIPSDLRSYLDGFRSTNSGNFMWNMCVLVLVEVKGFFAS